MRRLMMVACCLFLAACYSTGKQGGDSALNVYDFGPPVLQSPAVTLRSELAVEVRAPLWMDSMGIEYRLLYADPARLRNLYARALGRPAGATHPATTDSAAWADAGGAGQDPLRLAYRYRCVCPGFRRSGDQSRPVAGPGATA